MTSSSALFKMSSAGPKCVDNTWEEGVLELLRTTHNSDTIQHICRLPFRDRNAPLSVLAERWDSGLDRFLTSFAARDRQNEIIGWSRDCKAKELQRLLQRVARRPSVWRWGWNPPSFASQDSSAIADEFHDVINSAIHRVTLQEWASYLLGKEEHAVTSLWSGVLHTRNHLHQQLQGPSPRNKYEEVEKELRSRHRLAHWILASSLELNSLRPQDTLDSFFRPILDLFASRDPARIVNRFALMANEGEGEWSKLSTTLTLNTCHGSGGPLDAEAWRLFLKDGTRATLLGVFDIELYRLIRLSTKEHYELRGLLEQLDKEISNSQVCSAIELADESWELVARESYLPELVKRLGEMFPNSHVDQDYNPCEPSEDEVCYFGYNVAKSLRIQRFSKRSRDMSRCAWQEAAAYYAYCMERDRGQF